MAITARLALLAGLLTVSISTATAAERYEAKSWRRVKTYDMAALQKIDPLPLRQIVGVRFGYRHPDIRHLKPNWFYSSIWSVTRDGDRADFSHIPVMVAKADLEAFRRLPTNPESAGKFVVYGQVLRDSEAGFLFLRLIGTKVRNEKRGRVAVGW
jgi:hypothetical protein